MENVLSLDLEFNQPSQTIIQVGYCIGNVKTGEVLEKRCFDIHCKEEINPFITTLTGVTQSDVDNSEFTLEKTYEVIKEDKEKYQFFSAPLTWGHGDLSSYKEQAKLPTTDKIFGRRYTDVKTVFITYCVANDIMYRSGLSKSMRKLGLSFDGRKHNAMCDAINTFVIYHELLKRMKNES
jgi:inhibitor of KinA sporulation pathway (predicted exonuclease)